MKHLLVHILIAVLPSSLSFAEDIDEDGLDDSYEQQVIDAFRPVFYYDAQEDHWPSTLLWVTERANLNRNGQLVYGQPALGNNPLLLLQGAAITGAPSTTIESPNDSTYRLGLAWQYMGGQGPIPVGTYARVTPITGSIIYATQGGNQIVLNLNGGDMLLQYWQFYPYNDNQAGFPGCDDIGDHTCDWIWLDLVLSSGPVGPSRIRYIVYHHHGDRNCTPTVLEPGHPWFPTDGIPRCYLEESTHEPWARPSGSGEESCTFETGLGVADHDGNGAIYRTNNVKNVGEIWAPMPDTEAVLFLHYNGRWGEWAAHCFAHTDEPAVSPIFQFYPSAYKTGNPNPSVPIWFSYLNPNAPAWSQNGTGSRYHPYRTMAEAAENVVLNGTIRVAQNVAISTPATISKPLTIEAFVP